MFRPRREIYLTLALIAVLVASSASVASARGKTQTTPATCGWDSLPGWVQRENAKAGNSHWAQGIPVEFSGEYGARKRYLGITKWLAHSIGTMSISGWFDSPSATCGAQVGLHISGNDIPVTVSVFRMGYYGGAGARLISTDTTRPIKAYSFQVSPAPESTVSTTWPVGWNFKITQATPPGQYLVRLDDSSGHSSFVPLVVFNPEISSSITFVSSILTWQAYNHWGGYSLYKGPTYRRSTRSRVASFNRPYDGDGAGEFRYLEYPIVKLAEKLGIDMNYITDLELDKNIASLHKTDSILLGGHSEYWTNGMRNTLQSSVDSGINLVSLGGNAGYNRARLQNNNQVAMWRSHSRDPYKNDPIMATTAWRDPPIRKPESLLLGAQYVGLGANGDYIIRHPTRWPFLVMKHPEVLQSIVGREVDSPLYAVGPAVEILASSAIQMYGKAVTTMATYYTNAKGAGVIDISTNGWACAIDNVCPWHPNLSSATQEDVGLVTGEILKGLTEGPLGKWRPAIPDLSARTKISALHSPFSRHRG
jgi:hypothetical protein